MKPRHVTLIAVIVAIAGQLSYRPAAQGQDVKAAYDRAESFNRRTEGLVAGIAETPIFIEGSSKLWYRKSVKGGNEFVLVDAAAKTKTPAFDHARLAAALSAVASATVHGRHAAVRRLHLHEGHAGHRVLDRRDRPGTRGRRRPAGWRAAGRRGRGRAAVALHADRLHLHARDGLGPPRKGRAVKDAGGLAGPEARGRSRTRACATHPTTSGRR